MVFGRRKKAAEQQDDSIDESFASQSLPDEGSQVDADDDSAISTDPEVGPFDLGELDEDRVSLAETRLDLGSVLIPLPAGGQLQVEMTPGGVPQAVHIVTQHGRITIAAYAAPKSPGQWREVASDLASSLRGDNSSVSVQTGPWGRELHGVTANADLRFIGIDGYRWMVRCVLAGPAGAVDDEAPLVHVAREVLSQTVVDRGTDPHPVRTPLPVVLPPALTAQLAAAQQQQAEQAAAAQQNAAAQQDARTPGQSPASANPVEGPRRGTSGSAMQQLGG